ncbi:Transcription factor MYB86 [Acorus gramineus]|uniref:Transcription factor MYB86 n=1 Tax=Acorus gramineus TaxID=55184 RepID=A0AAV9BMG1_ACOGR|nr:Transcription factor MYB86 [Acorus gramineus]
MGRHSCCYKQKLRKGLWSPEEDEKLLRHITKYGHGCWSSVPKQAGIDPNTHKPLSDIERGEEKASATTTHSDKASGSPSMDKLSLAESKPPLLVPDRNPFQASTNNSMTPTKEFFLDRFIGGQADAARNSDTMGYLSLPQLNYEADNQSASAGLSMNPNLWFGQSCVRPFELSPDFSCNTISTLVPSVTSSNLSTPMGLMPLLGLPNENPPLGCVNVNGIQYWETGSCSNSCSSSGSNSSIGLRGQNSTAAFFDGGVFPWELTDCRVESSELTSDKEVGVQIEGDPDELKWSEYLHPGFPISAALQGHGQASFYDNIKCQSQFDIGIADKEQNYKNLD